MSVISLFRGWANALNASNADARIIRLCYEVKTAVDLTEQLALGPPGPGAGGSAMRSLQPGEILEAADIGQIGTSGRRDKGMGIG